jgi:hypothetical protein
MDQSSRAVVGPLEPTVVQQWWQPHPLDKWGQMFLLEIASSAAPPDTQPGDSPDWCGDVTLPARDGWKVCFFYDCGDLDYIDHFVTPEGEKLDVFADGYQSEQWPPVMCWSGNADTERFRGLLHNAELTGRRGG